MIIVQDIDFSQYPIIIKGDPSFEGFPITFKTRIDNIFSGIRVGQKNIEELWDTYILLKFLPTVIDCTCRVTGLQYHDIFSIQKKADKLEGRMFIIFLMMENNFRGTLILSEALGRNTHSSALKLHKRCFDNISVFSETRAKLEQIHKCILQNVGDKLDLLINKNEGKEWSFFQTTI